MPLKFKFIEEYIPRPSRPEAPVINARLLLDISSGIELDYTRSSGILCCDF